MTSNPHPAYRPDIDGLRALAILSVITFHAFPNSITGGFVGVDIFFVISGFLISSIIFKGLNQGTFSFVDFYARRIRRIFPALIIVISACLILGWFVLFPDEYKQLNRHASAGMTYISNFIFVKESGYFDTKAELKPLLHLWSLGIEEQYYIIWPLLMFLAYRYGLNLLTLTIVIMLISFAMNVSNANNLPVHAFFMPHTRFWELLIGSSLAYISLSGGKQSGLIEKYAISRQNLSPTRKTLLNNLKAWAGISLLAIAVLIIDKTWAFPGWWAVLPTLGAMLLIDAGPGAWFNRKILAHRALVFIGLISYPLYLWHWPLLSFARIIESGAPSPGITFAAISLSVLLAWLTYRLLEKPIRAKRTLTTPVVLFILGTIVAGISYYTYKHDGLILRPDERNTHYAVFKWPKSKATQEDCKLLFGFPNLDFCLRTDALQQPTMLLVGDSHANTLFWGLSQYYKERHQNLFMLGSGACIPFYNIETQRKGHKPECKKLMSNSLDYALQTKSVKTVILASRGPLYTSGQGYGDSDERDLSIKSDLVPKSTDYSEIFVKSMQNTLARLVQANKEVVFVIDTPELGFNPQACVYARTLRNAGHVKTPCAIAISDFNARNHDYRGKIYSALKDFPNVKIFDPSKYLCDDQYCWAMKDGKILYRDDDHLSFEGSMYIADKFLK